MFHGNVVAMFPVDDGHIIICGVHGDYIGYKVSEIFMSSLSQHCDMINVSAMGGRDFQVPGLMTFEMTLTGCALEVVVGKDLLSEYDPTNMKSNLELLEIIYKRKIHEKHSEDKETSKTTEGE